MNRILKSIINKQRRDFGQLASSRHIPEKSMEGVRQARGIRYKQDGFGSPRWPPLGRGVKGRISPPRWFSPLRSR